MEMSPMLIDQRLYSKTVLLKTAYCFTDRVYIHLSDDGDGHWLVSWHCKEGYSLVPAEFENELIAQELRNQLLEKTADIRKLILARAFASTVVDTKILPQDSSPTSINNGTESQSILRGWFSDEDSV